MQPAPSAAGSKEHPDIYSAFTESEFDIGEVEMVDGTGGMWLNFIHILIMTCTFMWNPADGVDVYCKKSLIWQNVNVLIELA